MPNNEEKMLWIEFAKQLREHDVPNHVIVQAERAARRKCLGVSPLAPVPTMSEMALDTRGQHHTLVSLALSVALDVNFPALQELHAANGNSHTELEMWIVDLGECAEAAFSKEWYAEERDFIEDMDNLAHIAVLLSLAGQELEDASLIVESLGRGADIFKSTATSLALRELLRVAEDVLNAHLDHKPGDVDGLLTGDVFTKAVEKARDVLS